MERPFFLVDAFTSRALGGNPCAVVLNAEGLSDESLLAIAREMNQSETAFLFRRDENGFRARYFTPEREIPLAGHPTVASVHTAIEAGWLAVGQEGARFTVELNDGPIFVDVEDRDDGRWIKMFQRQPTFHAVHDPAVVMPLFGLQADDLHPGARLETVSTGTKQLMIFVKSLDVLKRMTFDRERYLAYRNQSDFFSPHLFCLGGISPDATTFARHPGIPFEDPFTGSSTGGMSAYLWKHGYLKTPMFVAEQGHWMHRPGRALVEVHGPRDAIETVSVAGQAVTTVRGVLTV